MIIPVILSGGSGSRLWPLSRENYPKQLLPLVGDQTMLQETIDRLQCVKELTAPIVVCNDHHRFIVAQQLAEARHKPEAIILEPCGRNTAPAVAVAALQAMAKGLDPVLLVLPADHVIRDAEALCAAVETAYHYAQNGRLLTFGIEPDAPETGYGYIRANKDCHLSLVTGGSSLVTGESSLVTGESSLVTGESSLVDGHLSSTNDQEPITKNKNRRTNDQQQITNNATVFSVADFVEKPDRATAEKYLATGDYYWNSGMFMFKASCYLNELQRYAPEMLEACRESLERARFDADFIRLDAVAFEACPSDSIDYAVMEKTDAAAVIPLAAGWSDVGSWSALWEALPKDGDGNVTVGSVYSRGVKNSYLHTEEGRILAVIGLDDVIVVDTADAVLVTRKDRCQEVKEIVNLLKLANREEPFSHRKVYRPWGNYESIDRSERFQVKRITVKPGGNLSQQMHHHRAEHWVVVSGTARITKGDEVLLLSENQSTYIPLGITHRLENPGKIDLEMIEVQSGSYLGEDDIVRFDDQYGRC